MRIYGGHDYYDCGLSLGIDPTITLVRSKDHSISVKEGGFDLLAKVLEFKPQYYVGASLQSVAVAFCGRVYRGAIGTWDYGKPEFMWSEEKALEWVQQKKKVGLVVSGRWSERKKVSLAEYFAPADAPEAFRDYMINNKFSILVEHQSDWKREEKRFLVNPFTLKQIGFAKALDPYTAFQELSMWIGGILGGNSPETVTITNDKVLAESHGFDKFSFRGPRVA